MANNRYNQQKVDYTPREERKKEVEIPLNLKPCLKCGKSITTGYYSHIDGGGLCSKKCNDTYVKQENNHENAVRVTAFNGAIYQPS